MLKLNYGRNQGHRLLHCERDFHLKLQACKYEHLKFILHAWKSVKLYNKNADEIYKTMNYKTHLSLPEKTFGALS